VPGGYWPDSLILSDCLERHSFSGFGSFSRRAPHKWAVLLLVIMEIGFVGLLASP
jgi:hypothetical protein